MEKRYYWLKFRADFFDSKRVKKLRKMKRGDTLLIIYLKMQLKALPKGGAMEYTGVEDSPAEEFALDLDESPKDVQTVLDFLLANDLVIKQEDGNWFLPYVEENTGSETASAQRVRDYRGKQKTLHCNEAVTQVKRSCSVEKEKEKEKDSPYIPHGGKRERNTLKNYREEPGTMKINEIDLSNIGKALEEL